jgi:hypothetical protein
VLALEAMQHAPAAMQLVLEKPARHRLVQAHRDYRTDYSNQNAVRNCNHFGLCGEEAHDKTDKK